MAAIQDILMLLLNVAWWFVIIHIIMSWLIQFGVLNIQQQFVASVWNGLNQLLQPIYGRVRRVLPQTGALDLAPLVVLLGIIIAQILVVRLL